MSDVDDVREALTVLHRRLQEEGYGPQSGQPDPEDVFNAALAALDRMEAVEKVLREKLFGWQAVYAESGRLREALREIAGERERTEGGWAAYVQDIARLALGEEVPLPRSFLDDPKIQEQIAEAKERARKGGEQAP